MKRPPPAPLIFETRESEIPEVPPGTFGPDLSTVVDMAVNLHGRPAIIGPGGVQEIAGVTIGFLTPTEIAAVGSGFSKLTPAQRAQLRECVYLLGDMLALDPADLH